MFDQQLPRLEGLLALSGSRGLDVRPTLLRVLTDLFVAAQEPTPADVIRFEELAGHLVDQVDVETRVIIAEKLGPCAYVPRSILDRLLAMEPGVAGPILAHSPVLTQDELWSLVADGGVLTLQALALRTDLDLPLVQAIARQHGGIAADILAENQTIPVDRETVAMLAGSVSAPAAVARRLARRADVDRAWLTPLILHLDIADRTTIIEAALKEARPRVSTRDSRIDAPALILAALEAAALAGDSERLALGLAELFGADPAVVRLLVASHDMLALALAAIGMPTDQATRVLMFARPQNPLSVADLRGLTALMETVPRMTATRLLRTALATPQAPIATARHEPALADSQSPNRQTPAATRIPAQSRPETRDRRSS